MSDEDPALEGEYQVNGQTVSPAFSIIKKSMEPTRRNGLRDHDCFR